MHMQIRTRRADQSGLGLLEVLIAISIFAIGIMAVVTFFPGALRQLQIANQRTVASELAQTNLAEVRVATAQALLNRQFLSPGVAIQQIYSIYGVYNRGLITTYNASVAPLRGGASTFLQRVTFNVLMPDGREEVYVTYVAKQ